MFDPAYQSPRPVNAPAQPQQPSSWERSVRTPWSALPSEPSPDGWSTGDGTSSLTVSNLEQHNQQQLRPEPTLSVLPEVVPAATESNLLTPEAPQRDVPAVKPPTDIPPVAQDEALEPPATKPRKKPVSPAKGTVSQPQPQPQVQQQPQPSLPSKPQATPSVSLHSPPVKTVWSKDDDGKKASGVSIGFREIQEAEAKQSEVRKVALERERVATAARNISTPTDDPPVPTITSWGLLTSQVQTGRKEPTSVGSPTPAVPVWTNVVKPPTTKKTMKEIQEEERRKKAEQQQTQEKETINAAVRRSHAEAVSKVFVFALDHLVSTLTDLKTPTVTPGPAWTTVGANGRSSVVSQHVRPAVVVSSPSTPPLATRPPTNGASQSLRSPTPAKVVTPAAKHDDAAANPSLDFLKWLADSLKGLNQSVNRT
jgi:PERQ amino acid-rich with GYF domain-containing protein